MSEHIAYRRRYTNLYVIQYTGDNNHEIQQWLNELRLHEHGYDPQPGEWLIYENGVGSLLSQERFDAQYELVPTNQTTYRLGSHQKQNVYRHDTDDDPNGHYIGVFFDPRDARHACNALNAYDKNRDTDDTIPPPRPKRDRNAT